MGRDLYEVWVGPSMIATGMNLDVIMILVEALIKKWYSGRRSGIQNRRRRNEHG